MQGVEQEISGCRRQNRTQEDGKCQDQGSPDVTGEDVTSGRKAPGSDVEQKKKWDQASPRWSSRKWDVVKAQGRFTRFCQDAEVVHQTQSGHRGRKGPCQEQV